MDEYATVARFYDTLITPALRPLYTVMVDRLSAARAGSVIDLCCGTGTLVQTLAEAGMQATGADLSPHMLTQARLKHEGVTFLHGDATALPLPDNGFDGATVSFALHEKAEATAQDIIKEAKRLVRPGGLLLVADYRLPEPGSARFSGWMIRFIERLAGREHHAHFTDYMQAGGSDTFLERANVTARCIETAFSGWAGIYEATLPG